MLCVTVVPHLLSQGRPSAIPSFFRGPKCNRRLALRCDNSRMTSPEARVRGSELSRKRPRHAQCAPSGPPFAPYEGQRASQSGRSRNEGIPEHALKHTPPFRSLAPREVSKPEVRIKRPNASASATRPPGEL